jgi:hypothetical protein
MTDQEFLVAVVNLVDHSPHGDSYENIFKIVEEKFKSTNCASQQLLALVGVLKDSATVSTTAVLKVLYDEFPQLLA